MKKHLGKSNRSAHFSSGSSVQHKVSGFESDLLNLTFQGLVILVYAQMSFSIILWLVKQPAHKFEHDLAEMAH